MTALAIQQADFQHALLRDQPLPDGQLTPRSAPQFGVYRMAYRARLRAALRDNYEVLPQVMGDEDFDALANAYIAAHPSQHYSLRWFGHRLPDFMAQHATLVPHPALTDLAQMEWALRQAFDAPDTAPLLASTLQALAPHDWGVLQLDLQACAQTLHLHWAVGPVWHAVQSGAEHVSAPEALDHTLLVWRRGRRTQWKTLDASEALFVQGLQAQQPFGALCQQLATLLPPEAASAAAASHLRWLLDAEVLAAHSYARNPS